MEDNIDKLEGEDDSSDSAVAGSDEEQSESDEDEESFIQTSRNIDDENAEAAEMAKMEDNIDKLEGEDETADSAAAGSDEEQSESDEDEESFIQTGKNIDDENAEAAEMAKMRLLTAQLQAAT